MFFKILLIFALSSSYAHAQSCRTVTASAMCKNFTSFTTHMTHRGLPVTFNETLSNALSYYKNLLQTISNNLADLRVPYIVLLQLDDALWKLEDQICLEKSWRSFVVQGHASQTCSNMEDDRASTVHYTVPFEQKRLDLYTKWLEILSEMDQYALGFDSSSSSVTTMHKRLKSLMSTLKNLQEKERDHPASSMEVYVNRTIGRICPGGKKKNFTSDFSDPERFWYTPAIVSYYFKIDDNKPVLRTRRSTKFLTAEDVDRVRRSDRFLTPEEIDRKIDDAKAENEKLDILSEYCLIREYAKLHPNSTRAAAAAAEAEAAAKATMTRPDTQKIKKGKKQNIIFV